MKEIKVDYKNVPNCLRKFRKINGYTQREVATLTGVCNASMISRWENGHRFPDPQNIFRLAILYRTMADALYTDLIRELRQEMQVRRKKLEKKRQSSEVRH